jgi:hypothetical protein
VCPDNMNPKKSLGALRAPCTCMCSAPSWFHVKKGGEGGVDTTVLASGLSGTGTSRNPD